MFIILNWPCYDDILPVINEDGTTMLFDTYKKAEKYAEKELNFNWLIVEI